MEQILKDSHQDTKAPRRMKRQRKALKAQNNFFFPLLPLVPWCLGVKFFS
jgi:hypothetical protein